jgi:hypothetical protein
METGSQWLRMTLKWDMAPITVDGDRLLLVEDVSVWVWLPLVRYDNGCGQGSHG